MIFFESGDRPNFPFGSNRTAMSSVLGFVAKEALNSSRLFSVAPKQKFK